MMLSGSCWNADGPRKGGWFLANCLCCSGVAGGAFLAKAKVLCISGVFGTRITKGSSSNKVLVSLGSPNEYSSPVMWER